MTFFRFITYINCDFLQLPFLFLENAENVSLDIKMAVCFLENKLHRISEIAVLPPHTAKLLYPIRDEIPCKHKQLLGYHVRIMGRKNMSLTARI